ncbi:MAG: hypothetical protein Q8R28_12550 [Dehalococcoidia bacterium]|nr:hypothetical protein [Dehalococcoidia bacterium]
MMWSKVCPRCKGDVYIEEDIFETNLKCLQCGHVLNEAEKRAVDSGPEVRQRTSGGQEGNPDKRAA